mmetsp:Transcript_16291/g.46937  ORF Transcript_16291/g.46937 Transcript_16291/m.46937 type:complete len:277 (-) Transcript_16291:215-1045(-)
MRAPSALFRRSRIWSSTVLATYKQVMICANLFVRWCALPMAPQDVRLVEVIEQYSQRLRSRHKHIRRANIPVNHLQRHATFGFGPPRGCRPPLVLYVRDSLCNARRNGQGFCRTETRRSRLPQRPPNVIGEVAVPRVTVERRSATEAKDVRCPRRRCEVLQRHCLASLLVIDGGDEIPRPSKRLEYERNFLRIPTSLPIRHGHPACSFAVCFEGAPHVTDGTLAHLPEKVERQRPSKVELVKRIARRADDEGGLAPLFHFWGRSSVVQLNERGGHG